MIPAESLDRRLNSLLPRPGILLEDLVDDVELLISLADSIDWTHIGSGDPLMMRREFNP